MAKDCLTSLFAMATIMTFPGFLAVFILVHIASQSPLYFMAEIGDDLPTAGEFLEVTHGCDEPRGGTFSDSWNRLNDV